MFVSKPLIIMDRIHVSFVTSSLVDLYVKVCN
jgi:hypothetical protein